MPRLVSLAVPPSFLLDAAVVWKRSPPPQNPHIPPLEPVNAILRGEMDFASVTKLRTLEQGDYPG